VENETPPFYMAFFAMIDVFKQKVFLGSINHYVLDGEGTASVTKQS